MCKLDIPAYQWERSILFFNMVQNYNIIKTHITRLKLNIYSPRGGSDANLLSSYSTTTWTVQQWIVNRRTCPPNGWLTGTIPGRRPIGNCANAQVKEYLRSRHLLTVITHSGWMFTRRQCRGATVISAVVRSYKPTVHNYVPIGRRN